MNIYDPMDRIVYRHMDERPEPYSVPISSTLCIHRLPVGYTNCSPRTYLRSNRRVAPAV